MRMAQAVLEVTTACGMYRILNLGVPEFVEGRPNNEAWANDRNVSTGGRGLGRRLRASTRALASSCHGVTRPAVDTSGNDGA